MSDEGADETCDQTGLNSGQNDKASDKSKESVLHENDSGCGSSTKTSASANSAPSQNGDNPLVKTSDTSSSEDSPSLSSKDTSTNEDEPSESSKDTFRDKNKPQVNSNITSGSGDNPPASSNNTSSNEDNLTVNNKDTSKTGDNPLARSDNTSSSEDNSPASNEDTSSNGDNPSAISEDPSTNEDKPPVNSKDASSDRDKPPESSNNTSRNEDKPSGKSMDASSDKSQPMVNHADTSSNEGKTPVNSKDRSSNDEKPSVNRKHPSSKRDKPPGRKRHPEQSGYFGGSMFSWLQSAGNAAIGEITEGIAAIGAKMFVMLLSGAFFASFILVSSLQQISSFRLDDGVPWAADSNVKRQESNSCDCCPGPSSCKEIYDKDQPTENKAYMLQLGSQKLPVYCHMTGSDLGDCGRGGWTLVMKIDGSKRTFHYDSPYWTDKREYGIPEGETGLDQEETKLPTYWNTPFTRICLGMKIGHETRFILLSKKASSLYALIQDGKYRPTSLGRVAWKFLIGPEASLQSNCNREGFNVMPENSNHAKARIGLIANQENDCHSTDSRIGFGTGGFDDDSNTCGNEATHDPDNGHKHIKAMGYILVQ